MAFAIFPRLGSCHTAPVIAYGIRAGRSAGQNTMRIFEKKRGSLNQCSDVQGLEPVLAHFTKLQADLGVKGTDRADIIIG